MSKRGPTYAPLPARAIGDKRLSGLHLRVLAAIALHDRLSGARGQGQGCWASNKRLAEVASCNYSNLSTACTDLSRFGYLERSTHPLNKRLRIYRVVYDDGDHEAAHSLPNDKLSKPSSDGNVCHDFGESEQNQSVNDVEYIPQKREHITQKREIDSAKAASPSDGAGKSQNLGGELAKIERTIKAGEFVDHQWLSNYLTEIVESLEFEDPNHQRAARMLEEMGA